MEKKTGAMGAGYGRGLASLMLMSDMLDGPYSLDKTEKYNRSRAYCHTCIVGRKNPELCEKCDRK
jgi:hypothetical protein